MEKKSVLLIAGAGTLGCYTSLEMLKLGFQVDVIAPEDVTSLNRNLTYIKAFVSDELLRELFAAKKYDVIIDFIHYPDPKQYEQRMELLLSNTEQLIFLSSYRVYADLEHPIRETSPQLLDVTQDAYLLEHENYAIPKSYCERMLRASSHKNWTIVRPLISFSHFRLDLVTLGAPILLGKAQRNERILLPLEAKEKTAGVGWAGNIGKMFARLALNEKALCEDFTLGTGENLLWSEVADYYSDAIGAQFDWVGNEEYLAANTDNSYMHRCMLFHDRLLDRTIDSSKILQTTGLGMQDFLCTRDALLYELEYIAAAASPRIKAFLPPNVGR